MTTTQNFDALAFRFKPRAEYQDDDFCAKAAALFDGGAKKAEAAEQLGVRPAVAHLAAQVHWFGRIPFTSQDELAKAVVKAREEGSQGPSRGRGQGWSVIGARAGGLPERRVQELYEQGSGASYVESRLAGSTRQRTEQRPEPAKKAGPAKPADKTKAEKAAKKPAARKTGKAKAAAAK